MRKIYIYASHVIKFIKWIIVTYAATVFFLMLFGNFILPTPSPISSRVDLKILKIIQNEFNESKEIYESALVEMNVDADFTPLFTFNTHSIFVSLIIEYETPTHSCNQIALWSFIIRNRTSAVLQIHQEMNTFNDITPSFKGVNGTYMMEWNIIPRLGVLRHGRAHQADALFTFPKLHMVWNLVNMCLIKWHQHFA